MLNQFNVITHLWFTVDQFLTSYPRSISLLVRLSLSRSANITRIRCSRKYVTRSCNFDNTFYFFLFLCQNFIKLEVHLLVCSPSSSYSVLRCNHVSICLTPEAPNFLSLKYSILPECDKSHFIIPAETKALKHTYKHTHSRKKKKNYTCRITTCWKETFTWLKIIRHTHLRSKGRAKYMRSKDCKNFNKENHQTNYHTIHNGTTIWPTINIKHTDSRHTLWQTHRRKLESINL